MNDSPLPKGSKERDGGWKGCKPTGPSPREDLTKGFGRQTEGGGAFPAAEVLLLQLPSSQQYMPPDPRSSKICEMMAGS